jgi:hypothetical protein
MLFMAFSETHDVSVLPLTISYFGKNTLSRQAWEKLILDIGAGKVYIDNAFRFGFGCPPSPEPAIKASGFFCA